MAQSLFRVFDEDHSGKLTFYEFMQVGIGHSVHSTPPFEGPCSLPTSPKVGVISIGSNILGHTLGRMRVKILNIYPSSGLGEIDCNKINNNWL